MEYLICLLPILGITVYYLLDRFLLSKRKKNKTQKTMLAYPKYYMTFTGIGFACLLSLGLWVYIAQNILAVLLTCIGFSLCFLFGFYYLLRYRIEICEDEIGFRSLFKTQEFNFLDVIVDYEQSVQIFDLQGKEIKRITGFVDANNDI